VIVEIERLKYNSQPVCFSNLGNSLPEWYNFGPNGYDKTNLIPFKQTDWSKAKNPISLMPVWG
jgi:hypothetical protein